MRKRRAVVIACGSLLLYAVVLAARRPAIVRLVEPGAVDPADVIGTVFNPLRSQGVERTASLCLAAIANGGCATALGEMPPDARRTSCAKEREHAMVAWQLSDRRENEGETALHYLVRRAGYAPGVRGSVWIKLRHDGQRWRVKDYDATY
jgi:hypothetical protein